MKTAVVVLVGILIAFAGCSAPEKNASDQSSAPRSSTPAPTSPSVLSEGDVADIEDVVRTHFSEYPEPLPRKRTTTGDLFTWANWLTKLQESPDQPTSTTTISRLEVMEAESTPDTAIVDFSATWRESGGDGQQEHKLSGPIEVARTDDGWKIVDYLRDGRPQTRAVSPRPGGGYQENGGVALQVLGVVLQRDYTAVFVTVENQGDAPYQPFEASLVTGEGVQLSQGLFTGPTEVFTGAKVTAQFFWQSPLPLTTKSLRLIVTGAETVNYSDRNFDLGLRLK